MNRIQKKEKGPIPGDNMINISSFIVLKTYKTSSSYWYQHMKAQLINTLGSIPIKQKR